MVVLRCIEILRATRSWQMLHSFLARMFRTKGVCPPVAYLSVQILRYRSTTPKRKMARQLATDRIELLATILPAGRACLPTSS